MPNFIRRIAGWVPRRLALVAALAAGLAFASSARAQTKFTWPDTTVDLGKYTSVDRCIAALMRIQQGQIAFRSQTEYNDTLPFDEQENLRPLPAPVRQAAARCAARFDQRTAKLSDFALLMELLLLADRDADAKALLERRLSAIGANGATERVAVIL